MFYFWRIVAVPLDDRGKLVEEMGAILEFCANARAEEKVEADLAARYLGTPDERTDVGGSIALPGAREE